MQVNFNSLGLLNSLPALTNYRASVANVGFKACATTNSAFYTFGANPSKEIVSARMTRVSLTNGYGLIQDIGSTINYIYNLNNDYLKGVSLISPYTYYLESAYPDNDNIYFSYRQGLNNTPSAIGVLNPNSPIITFSNCIMIGTGPTVLLYKYKNFLVVLKGQASDYHLDNYYILDANTFKVLYVSKNLYACGSPFYYNNFLFFTYGTRGYNPIIYCIDLNSSNLEAFILMYANSTVNYYMTNGSNFLVGFGYSGSLNNLSDYCDISNPYSLMKYDVPAASLKGTLMKYGYIGNDLYYSVAAEGTYEVFRLSLTPSNNDSFYDSINKPFFQCNLNNFSRPISLNREYKS